MLPFMSYVERTSMKRLMSCLHYRNPRVRNRRHRHQQVVHTRSSQSLQRQRNASFLPGFHLPTRLNRMSSSVFFSGGRSRHLEDLGTCGTPERFAPPSVPNV